MRYALVCPTARTFVRLERNPLRVDTDTPVPPGVLGDPRHGLWAWDRGTLVETAPAVAACDALLDHAQEELRLAFFDEDAGGLVGVEEQGAEFTELRLGEDDRAERGREPELRAAIAADDAGPWAEREHALWVARAWHSEPAERDRLLQLGSAEAFVREFRLRGSETRYRDGLPAGSEVRRDAYRRVVDHVREGEEPHRLRQALRIAARELGLDDEASQRVREDLSARACDAERPRRQRAGALSLLLEHWPGAHVALRERGRLAREPLPGWPAWDGVRFQAPLAQLVAATQDPEDLEGLLADPERPAACQLGSGDELPGDRWAIESAAQVAGWLAAIEPAQAPRYEPLVRRRILARPADGRFAPRRLVDAHRALCAALGPAEGKRAALEVLEQSLEAGDYDWDRTGAQGYVQLWHRRWESGPELAERLLGRVRDAEARPLQRIAARQALADLARDVAARDTAPVGDLVAAADACLLAALRDEGSPDALRGALRAHLDRFLSPEAVGELRDQGLLEAAPLPPYGEVPGAATGNGNALYPALDELSRKVELEQVLEVLERLPAREGADALGRGATAVNLVERLAKRYPDAVPRLERALRPLLGVASEATHPRRSWLVDQWALEAHRNLITLLSKAGIDDPEAVARGALEGVLRRRERPTSYLGKNGLYGAQAVSKSLARKLSAAQKASLAGWLEAQALDPERSAYARLNARWGIAGLGDAALLEAADRRLLAVLADADADPALRAELHALLAPRLIPEVTALQDEGVLPALSLEPIEALHTTAHGGVMRNQVRVDALVARQHPQRLIAAIRDGELGLGELCTALLAVPSACARGADPQGVEAALHACFADRRQHEAGGGRWVLATLAVEANTARLSKHPERTARLEAGLEAALAAEAARTVELYRAQPDAQAASRARSEHGPFVARACANALFKAAKGAAFDALEGVARDEERAPAERLAALDAFSQGVVNAPKSQREELVERRGALLEALAEAGVVVGGEAIEGVPVAVDWTRQGMPGFVWNGG